MAYFKYLSRIWGVLHYDCTCRRYLRYRYPLSASLFADGVLLIDVTVDDGFDAVLPVKMMLKLFVDHHNGSTVNKARKIN